MDVLSEYENIMYKLCDELFEKKEEFPVTLVFLSIFYMSEAVMYLRSRFGDQNISSSIYSAICSGQDTEVTNFTTDYTEELKKD